MTACPAWLQLFWYAGLREAGVGVSSKEDQSTSMPAESRGRLHAYILALRWISLTGFSTDGRTDGRTLVAATSAREGHLLWEDDGEEEEEEQQEEEGGEEEDKEATPWRQASEQITVQQQ